MDLQLKDKITPMLKTGSTMKKHLCRHGCYTQCCNYYCVEQAVVSLDVPQSHCSLEIRCLFFTPHILLRSQKRRLQLRPSQLKNTRQEIIHLSLNITQKRIERCCVHIYFSVALQIFFKSLERHFIISVRVVLVVFFVCLYVCAALFFYISNLDSVS